MRWGGVEEEPVPTTTTSGRRRTRRIRMRSAISFLPLNDEQPAPQIPVGRLLAVQLNIETARSQIIDLRLGELDRSRDGAARFRRRSEIPNRHAAHSGLLAAKHVHD